MSDSNPPAMSISNMRLGGILAEGKSTVLWNVTITRKDGEGNNTDEAYILKMFKNNKAFINEVPAYKRMLEIPTLEGRVPRYYGIVDAPRSILLSKHDGVELGNLISNLLQGQRTFVKQKVTQTLEMLHEAGVSHGKLTSKNIIIIVDKGDVKLINFSDACLKEDVQELEWNHRKARDQRTLGGIFYEVESAEAHEQAASLLERLRNGIAIAEPQPRLVTLLRTMGRPEEEILDSIMDVYKNPKPVLALELADCLINNYERYAEAIEILTQAASRFDNQSLNQHDKIDQMGMQMKLKAARYSVWVEQSYEGNTMPPSNDRYEDAIRFYLRLVPRASLADRGVLKLRYELAKSLRQHSSLRGYAMDVCVRAFEGATEAGREVPLDFLKDYGLLIEEVKSELSVDIRDTSRHMWQGKEFKSAPWAELPMIEQMLSRATEARRLFNQLWASEWQKKAATEEGSGMIWDFPVDLKLEELLAG